MATLVQTASNVAGFADHLDITVSALTAGNVLFVGARCAESVTLTIAATGVTFTTVEGAISNSSGSFDIRGYLWRGVVNSSGATVVTITEGTGANIHGVLQEWNGPDGTTDQHTNGETTSANTAHDVTANVTTVSANELLIGVMLDTGGSSTRTAGSGYTKSSSETGGVCLQYQVVSVTGSYGSPWTGLTADGAVTLLGTFPVAAGGGITVPRLERGTRGANRGMPGRIL